MTDADWVQEALGNAEDFRQRRVTAPSRGATTTQLLKPEESGLSDLTLFSLLMSNSPIL